MKTVKGLLDHCRLALKNNVQYIYGAKMQVMTYNQIVSLQKMYGTNYIWKSDLNKANKLCCDCSGLISSYIGVTRGSSQYKSSAKETVTITEVKKNWKKYVGWAFWMSGHIGVVSDTEGYYYAMDGSARNMVHYPISMQNWTCAIKIVDIDYSNNEIFISNNTVTGIVNADILNIRKKPSENGDIISKIKQNSAITIVNKYNKDWYSVIYDNVNAYASAKYITVPTSIYNIKQSIAKLVECGCISTAQYWLNHYTDIQYLDLLILNMGLNLNSKLKDKKITDYQQAVNVLVSKGVISTSAYWIANVNKVQYLKELIINVANAFNE